MSYEEMVDVIDPINVLKEHEKDLDAQRITKPRRSPSSCARIFCLINELKVKRGDSDKEER